MKKWLTGVRRPARKERVRRPVEIGEGWIPEGTRVAWAECALKGGVIICITLRLMMLKAIACLGAMLLASVMR